MRLRLEKEHIQEIPFHGGRVMQVQVGAVLNPDGHKVFRYTRSMDRVGKGFRITLQYGANSSHVPFVFTLADPANDPLAIIPENDDAREIWEQPSMPGRSDLQQALQVIADEDIRKTT